MKISAFVLYSSSVYFMFSHQFKCSRAEGASRRILPYFQNINSFSAPLSPLPEILENSVSRTRAGNLIVEV